MRLCATIRCEPAIAAAIGRVEPVDGVPGTVFDTWQSPASYADPDGAWTNEALAYDGSLLTGADNHLADYGHYLELIPATPILCSAVRFYLYPVSFGNDLNIDVHITGGGWVNVASGSYGTEEWHQVLFAAAGIDKARIKSNAADELCLAEFEFGPMPEMITEFTVTPRLIAETTLVECS